MTLIRFFFRNHLNWFFFCRVVLTSKCYGKLYWLDCRCCESFNALNRILKATFSQSNVAESSSKSEVIWNSKRFFARFIMSLNGFRFPQKSSHNRCLTTGKNKSSISKLKIETIWTGNGVWKTTFWIVWTIWVVMTSNMLTWVQIVDNNTMLFRHILFLLFILLIKVFSCKIFSFFLSKHHHAHIVSSWISIDNWKHRFYFWAFFHEPHISHGCSGFFCYLLRLKYLSAYIYIYMCT